jgi:uncharacterized protein (DUF1501 family)
MLALGATLPRFLIQPALARALAQPDDRVLVVLQLDGGNDSLSTLVPFGHKQYHEFRKATRIAESDVIKLNAELGLHPNLSGWKRLLDEGMFAAVQGIGYPNPNFSHFTATDAILMGDPRGRALSTGWVGRACDAGFPGNPDPKLAVAVGSSFGAALALRGQDHSGIQVNRPESFGYSGAENEQQAAAYGALNQPGNSTASGELDWVASTAHIANTAGDEIRRLAAPYQPKAEYPNSAYGRNLRAIAGLIAGGLSTRIYWTGREGRFEFDTHSGQRPKHDSLLAELDAAVTAFFDDLRRQGLEQRVLLMTISEFGRTSRENGNQGTDHGAAAAQFLFGPGVKAGIHGVHPSLDPAELLPIGASLKYAVDFRSLFATVLERWLRIPSEPALGQKWPQIDCIA